ncbi:hypothetical protein GO988_16625 [Hymenobacter sp. HMF4947]|uniref:GOLD domain-containing protein n=1 Tax=Hymenobacter ginkgonis TaxID=2682976 RepID=A0A7K1TI14_9BACT|nr:hypothetical protein [Hymenobacter ginkgonis]MVN77956.1 hypothetical protein [Hymenobacter ginkgonis]
MNILLFAAFALGLTSCLSTSPDTCQSTALTPVLSATGPKTIAVNQPATFTLSYEIQNGCGTFAGLQEQANTDTRLVGVNIKYDGCNCPQTVTPAQTTYTFQPTTAGTYYVRFVGSTGYLIDTLVAK